MTEKFNYHKLVNLRKRFEKYDCDISKELVAVIDKHLVLKKEKSKKKDIDRRLDYQLSSVECDICGKEILRCNLYKHKKNIHS